MSKTRKGAGLMKYLKTGITVVVALVLIVGCYYYVSHRKPDSAEDDVEVTELDEVLSKQLDDAYPPTPREVVRFYNRIIECAYGESYSDEQFEQLISQARKLMDEELLESNPEDEYKVNFKNEIASYKEEPTQILQTSVCDANEVEEKKIDGADCAFVKATYFLKEGNKKESNIAYKRTYQEYLLRKDQDGNWKILAYHLAEGDSE